MVGSSIISALISVKRISLRDFFRIGFYACSKSPGITMEARGPQAQPHTHTQGAPGGNPDAHWQASGNLEPAVTVSAPAHWQFGPQGTLSLSEWRPELGPT